jgi:hypothetical protein
MNKFICVNYVTNTANGNGFPKIVNINYIISISPYALNKNYSVIEIYNDRDFIVDKSIKELYEIINSNNLILNPELNNQFLKDVIDLIQKNS